MSDENKNTIAVHQASLDLFAFTKAIVSFVEKEPNRVRSFLSDMAGVKNPKKADLQDVRSDMGRCIEWLNGSINVVMSKIESAKTEEKQDEG